MNTNQINGKAIYSPKGKAGEYAKYAVNFYVGCSNDCSYCYCKRGVLGHAMGKPTPTLKKCFDGHNPYGVFIRELHEHIEPLRHHGLFFSFTTDPLLPETQNLTNAAVLYAVSQGVPCKILTKRADFKVLDSFYPFKHLIAYGFTLTGMDEMERNASTNTERIQAMQTLHAAGFHTFASVEPIISPEESLKMVIDALYSCDLFKIGLLSGQKNYTQEQIIKFVDDVNQTLAPCSDDPKVYYKDSVLQFVKLTREELHERAQKQGNNFVLVDRNYNLFQL